MTSKTAQHTPGRHCTGCGKPGGTPVAHGYWHPACFSGSRLVREANKELLAALKESARRRDGSGGLCWCPFIDGKEHSPNCRRIRNILAKATGDA